MTDAAIPTLPPGPHPTPEQLYRARRGPRNAEAERWLAHAAACAACSEELLRQEAFDEPEPVSPGRLAGAWERFGQPAARAPKAPVIPIRPIHPASPAAAGRPAPPRRTGLALAAALAAALVGLGLWMQTQKPPQAAQAAQAGPQDRVAATILRGSAAPSGTWQPAGLLEAPPAELVFPAGDGEPQRVTVFDSSHGYTWTSPPVSGGRVLFPEAEKKKLKRGVDYFWTVIGEQGAAARSFRLR